jgi:preprotein translocase subunit SecB
VSGRHHRRTDGVRVAPASLSAQNACVSHTAQCANADEIASGGISMTTTNGGPAQDPAPPQLNVLAQYIKDFSFENPNAPRSLQPNQQQPSINIQINVNAKPIADNDIEVELKLEGKAETSGTILFGFDLIFAGIFRIQNVPQEHVHQLVMIECPRLLFPFAREIVATAVRNGGFPPLLIDPIDFLGLYRQRMNEAQPQQFVPPTTV